MNCAHLFNGIGGFALAAHWMGWTNLMHCEIDSFCNRVMNHHFPNSFQHEDIRTTDFTIWRGRIDLLTGGFPCQPFSKTGKRKGTTDTRYVWPEMLRAIREIRPGWIVGENVYDFVNWSKGLVFEQVQADLENEGYQVFAYVLPAAGIDAPHRRDRVWLVAYTDAARFEGGIQKRIRSAEEANETFKRCEPSRTFTAPNWEQFPTQPPVCDRNDGFPFGLADITFSKWRNESLKALGNAIVPQVAFQIFKAIDQMTAHKQ